MDEFEQYRSRAYSAGSRGISARPTRSLPGTPRVKKYTLLQSLCGIRPGGQDDPHGHPQDTSPHQQGQVERQLANLNLNLNSEVVPRGGGGSPRSSSGAGSPYHTARLPGDGQDSTPGADSSCYSSTSFSPHAVLQQPPLGVLPYEVEPFRRAYSMKHHRPLTRFNSSPASSSSTTTASSTSSGVTGSSTTSCGSTAVSAISPPARTDSPTPNSWRGRSPNRPKDLDLGRPMRPRTSSMPARSQYRRPTDPSSRCRSAYGSNNASSGTGGSSDIQSGADSADDSQQPLRRVRSFKTTSKGIINRGDSFKTRKALSSSQASLDSVGNSKEVRPRTYSNASSKGSSNVSRGSSLEQDVAQYQVLMVGGQGVGKTALTQQFTTSEYMGNVDTAVEDEESRIVTVLLDGEESTMLVIDSSGEEDPCISVQLMPCADAYVVVYSVADKESFDEAVEVLHEIAKDKQRVTSAVILVANKGDIVRNRTVTEDEGKLMAVRYDVKYIEVSAVLNHKVDELLAGVLSQIRLKQRNRRKQKCLPEPDNGCVQGAARGIIGKLFKNHPYAFRSCDNLMVL